jgi:hypothetical protein
MKKPNKKKKKQDKRAKVPKGTGVESPSANPANELGRPKYDKYWGSGY